MGDTSFSNDIKNKLSTWRGKTPDAGDQTIKEKVTKAKEEYNKSLIALGEKMIAAGMTPEQVREELVVKEAEARVKENTALVPEKIQNVVKKAAGYYMGIKPPWVRQGLSVTIATGVLLGAGKVTALGAVGYAGHRFARSVIGSTLGQLAVSAKNKWWKSAEQDVAKVDAEFKNKAETQTFGTGALSVAALEALQKSYSEKLNKERNQKLKHMAIDMAIRMATGATVSLSDHFVSNNFSFGGHTTEAATSAPTNPLKPGKIDEETLRRLNDPAGIHKYEDFSQHAKVADPAHATATANPAATSPDADPAKAALITDPDNMTTVPDTHVYKDISVEYSSIGGIQTWADVKHKLIEAYKGVDEKDIPDEYKHIMHSRADALAKEFGAWRPGEEHESLSVLKGSTIEFDKHGNIISHSLKNLKGATEDEQLYTTGAEHADISKITVDERYIHGGHIEHASTATDPGLDKHMQAPSTATDPGLAKPDLSHKWDQSQYSNTETWKGHIATANSVPAEYLKPHTHIWWMNHIKNHPELGLDPRRLSKIHLGKWSYDFPTGDAHHVTGMMPSDDVYYDGDPTAHGITNHAETAVNHAPPANWLNHNIETWERQKLMLEPVSTETHTHDWFETNNFHNDPLIALHRMLYDFQHNGFPAKPNESIGDYLRRIKTEHVQFMQTHNAGAYPQMNPANPGGPAISEQIVGSDRDYFAKWEQENPIMARWLGRNMNLFQ